LLAIRRKLIERVLADPPDVYVGVDAKEFNLRVALKLKRRGIRTVQYVSPQVWAWRPGRVRTIGAAVDLVLCLLPFEPDFYAQHRVRAEFVGHPLADQIPLQIDQAQARAQLRLPDGEYLALLPGSRESEVRLLADDFARTVLWLRARRPGLRYVAALANPRARELFVSALAARGLGDAVVLVDGQATTVLAACDAVLLASGTATLEAMLSKKPMVVAYRLGSLTSFLLRHLKLFKAPFFAQPNLLVGQPIVPEFFNEQVRADVLGPAVLAQFERDRQALEQTFSAIHEQLRLDASARAADAIVQLINSVAS
jgi:lipid-A-disaccharide synthase